MAVLMAAVPPHERPRERLLARGAESLSERELLALVLRNGTPGQSALDLVADLLAEYGGLAALAGARPEELATRRGVGAAKAAAVVAAFQLARHAGHPNNEASVLRGPMTWRGWPCPPSMAPGAGECSCWPTGRLGSDQPRHDPLKNSPTG